MALEDLMCVSLAGNYGGRNKEAKSQITARTFVAAPLPVPSSSTLSTGQQEVRSILEPSLFIEQL